MSYATQQDLVDRFGEDELIQLTDRTTDVDGQIDATTITRALADASAMIDSYVGKQYATPLSEVPDALTKVACDLAYRYLHGDRVQKGDPVLIDHDAAIAWLKDVARGLVKLDISTGEPSQAGGGKIKSNAPDRIMSRQSLEGY